MLIDWLTVAAQIVNFLVLVALLKRFLYGPLIRAIDTREKGIAATLAEADEKNRAAAEHIAQSQAQLAELEQKRERILADAKTDADQQRGEMIQKARSSLRAMETRWREEMDRERAAFLEEMRARAAVEVLAISRRALAGLAGLEVERAAIQTFLGQIQNLDPSALRVLCAGDLVVATPGDLPPETQRQIREAIENRLGTPVRLRFEPAPAMAWGIELRGGGQRIGWTPDGYLDELEKKLNTALDRGATMNSPAAA